MKIKALNKSNFIKTYTKVTKSTKKEHNFIKVIDEEKDIHDFYISPVIAEKLKDVEYATPIYLELSVTYGTKDKFYDGVEVKDILLNNKF